MLGDGPAQAPAYTDPQLSHLLEDVEDSLKSGMCLKEACVVRD